MPRCRVVLPKSDRLPLSDGDHVDVITELNAGEYFDLLTDLADRKPFAKVLAYVLGWSLVGLDEKPLPYSVGLPENERRDTVRSLDKATVRELIAALDRHEATVETARAQKKTATAGTPDAPASSAT
jgi:hypothetical protein